MKKHVKKLLAMTLAIVMILSAVPLTSLFGNIGFLPTAEAAATEDSVRSVINSIKKDYPNGSYFSVNGKACPHASGNSWNPYCHNCELFSILNHKGISTKNYANGNTCFAFASYVFTKCFGKPMSFGGNSKKVTSGLPSYALFKQAKPGDVLIYKNKGDTCHYAIFVSCDKNGVVLYHANVNGSKHSTGKVNYGKWQYGSINIHTELQGKKKVKRQDTVQIWHAKNYDSGVKYAPDPKISTKNYKGGVTVTISASGSDIYYTTNGSAPSTSSKKYTGSFNLSSTATVKAISVKSGMSNGYSSQKITVNKTQQPKISSTLTSIGFRMSITSEKDADIYYTLDGSAPNTSSTKYSGKFTISENTTIRAIAVKNGKAYSAEASSTLSAAVPGTPSIQLDSSSNAKVGIGETATVKWNKISNTYNYIVTLKKDGAVVSEETTNTTSQSFVLSDVGTYSISVRAVNFVGESADSSPAVSVTVMPDVNVTFKDWNGTVLSSQSVHWGKSAVAPTPPSRKGYTFKDWNGNYAGVKSDSVVTARYTPNTYKVTFVDEAGTTLSSVTAEYDSAVTPPAAPVKTGYSFIGWSVKSGEGDSYTKVNGAVTFEPTYIWSNPDMPLAVTVTKALRSSDAKSYYVTAKITNATSKDINGKLIAVIKTANDKIAATEIDAITVPANASEKVYTTTIGGTNDAMLCEVYIMANDPENANRTGGAYSDKASVKVSKESTEEYSYWGEWSAWSTTAYTESATRNVESKVQYRYRDKQTTTSTNSSLSGWKRTGSTIKYGSWSSWSGWKNTKEESTATKDVQVDTRTAYKYQHYCDGKGNMAPFENYSSYAKYGPHVLYFTKKQPISRYSSVKSLKKYPITNNLSKCPKGMRDYYYMGTVTQYDCRSRSKTTVYSYEKWGNYSDWSDTVYTASSTRQVEKRTVYRYRDLIKSSQTTSSDYIVTENTSGTSYNISGQLTGINTDFSGKKATVLVYKNRNTDPTESQIEYIGQITLGKGNSYSFSFIPREEISEATGDYIVSFGIATSDGLVNNVEYIKAPKAKYKVEFLDTDGHIVSTQSVESGADAVAPTLDPIEGYTFKWNRAYTNITSDTVIRAEAIPETCNVIFVDWANDKIVAIKETSYGSTVDYPADCSAVGKRFVGWSTPKSTPITGTTIIEAVYEDITHKVNFLNKDGSIFFTEEVSYGSAAVLPEEIPTAAGYEFVAWSTNDSWWNVTSDMNVSPVFKLAETAETPVFDVYEDEYVNNAYITLSSDTDGAVIRYTLDGSEPTENSAAYDPEEAIQLSESAVVKASAFKENMNASPVAEMDINVVEALYDSPASSEEEPEPDPSAAQITVDSVTAHAGDEISVKVYVKNNPGFMYMKVRMYYDPSVLEFLGAENGTVSTDAFEIGAKTGDLMEAFIWNTSSDATGDGLLVTLKFKVAENAEVGEYSIKASPVEAYNYNEDEVTFVGVSSSINVVDFIYGDVNGDGKINGRDVVKLAKYLAAYNESTGESSVAVSPGADVNGDGKINGRDLVKLRKYLANYNESTGESTIVLGPSK